MLAFQPPLILVQTLAAMLLGNGDILNYDDGMKKPPWAVAQVVKDDERKLKAEFAEFLLFHPEDFKGAAEAVSDGDYGKIYVREKNWPNDAEVKQIKAELLAQKGPRHFIPTREGMIHHLWARANAKTTQGQFLMEDRDAIATHRLIGELAGYLGKGATDASSEGGAINQTIAITFVQPDNNKQENATIDITPIVDSDESSIPELKFVS